MSTYAAMSELSVQFKVTQMTCAGCAGRAQRALAAVPGVRDAQINLANHTAYVTGVAPLEALTEALTRAGYPAQLGDEVQEDEAKALRHDAKLAGLLTLPVFLIEMGGHLIPGLHHAFNQSVEPQAWGLVQFLLITTVMLVPGMRFYRIGLPMLFKGAPEMNALVALGTLAAWSYSCVSLFTPDLLPNDAGALYFESAGVIITLILMGRWLEASARGQTGAAIRNLLALRPDIARVERGAIFVDTPIDDIAVGDLIQLRSGERVAVDGVIETGHSSIDESMLTGEAMPAAKSIGDRITGGTVNGTGLLTYRATAIGKDTVLSRIVDQVSRAQGARLPVQVLADRIVRVFVPIVLGIALVTTFAWLIFGPAPALPHALSAAVAVLVIACPCAMGLATPTSIITATGRGAELGILFRKGEALQRLEDVVLVAFDKTGTLTTGKLQIGDRYIAPGFDEKTVLQLAASAEQGASHPIATAVLNANTQSLIAPDHVEDLPGFGLRARLDGKDILIGAPRLMDKEGIDLDQLSLPEAQTPVLVAINGTLAACFGLTDTPRADAKATIEALHHAGLKTAILSGDAPEVVGKLAQALGIDEARGGLLPNDKTTALEHFRAAYGSVVFVGDGINDAPALALADTGIAMAAGTDIAVEAGDIVLSQNRLHRVADALSLSKATMRNIRQNLFWAFAYNIALVPVAAGLFYPALGWQLSPMLGAGAMALSSIFVLANALRLRVWKPAAY